MSSQTRRTVLQLTVASLGVGFAGCTSTGPATTDTLSSETSEPTTETPTETQSTPQGTTVEYEALTADEQVLFDELLSKRTATRGSDRVSKTLVEAEFVLYQDSRYRIEKEQAGYIAEYALEATLTSDSNVEVGDLVAYGDLTQEAAAAFDEAQTGDRYTIRGETLPDQVVSNQYVEFDGEYYELTVIVADIPSWTFTATKVAERVARGF